MSKSGKSFLVTAVCLTVLCAAACSNKPPRVEQPGINPNAAADAMKQYDTDGDGEISGEELDKAPALKAAMATLDTDGDKAISADEIDARVSAWIESKLGRSSVMITVYRNNQPLEGATLKFIPESFLGDAIKPAEATTGESGVAMPTITEGDPNVPPGMHVGFYRVEVTKAGEEIPAKYNTETELGLEVAQDIPEEEIRFDLQY